MIRLVGATFYKQKETNRKLVNFITHASKLSFGPECEAFEKAFARWQGRKEAIFVNSGSSANLALIQALLNCGRLKKGDRVGFSAVTWSTNVMPLMSQGLVPIPIDISLDTLNVASADIERAISKHKLKAVFITNLLGLSHDLSKIKRLCKKRGVILLEDNCESLGSVEGGVKLGNFGLASTFSFFVGHHLSTIEGGMICTDDRELADALRIVRAHGWDRHLPPASQKRLRAKYKVDPFYGLYTFYDVGYNFRPSEINGFIGTQVLPYADEIVASREKTYVAFAKAALTRPDAYRPLSVSHLDIYSAFAFPVVCTSPEVKKRLIKACVGKVEIRPLVGGCMTLQPFFQKYYPKAEKQFPTPQAKIAHDLGLYLPIHPDMTHAEKKTIMEILTSV